MIFYNIRHAKEFYSEISKCTGRIDIISSDGNIEVLKDEEGHFGKYSLKLNELEAAG